MSSEEDRSFVADGLIATRVMESERSLKKAKFHNELQRLICPHCDQLLNVKTYKIHEKLYQKDDGSWIKPLSREPPETLEG